MNRRLIIWIGMLVCLCWISGAAGAEISIPALTGKPGQTVDVPIVIDQVDNLAGVKLAMKYDKDILTFKKAEKTQETSSLMHVVNDKTPGALIVVMAGAKGIKGKNFSIVTLSFDIKADMKTEQSTTIEIIEVQLMSDDLKNIEYKIKVNPIKIAFDQRKTKDAEKTKSNP